MSTPKNAEVEKTIIIQSLENHFTKGSIINNKYKIVKKLGHGGMGMVYQVEHLLLPSKKLFAMKILRPELSQDKTYKQRFFREVEIAMEFVHEHAIQIREFGETEQGLHFFTMDYSDGVSLKELLEVKGNLEVDRALNICRQILQALQSAHVKGIIHRDLKPENILIEKRDEREHALLLDLGIAKYIGLGHETDPNLTQNQIIGTPTYMSPEQANNETLDIQTDIYSLGIILYEMLAGRPPFQGKVLQIILAHAQKELPSLQNFQKDIPPAVENIVYKATQKIPKNRYHSALEFEEAILSISRSVKPKSRAKSRFGVPRKNTSFLIQQKRQEREKEDFSFSKEEVKFETALPGDTGIDLYAKAGHDPRNSQKTDLNTNKREKRQIRRNTSQFIISKTTYNTATPSPNIPRIAPEKEIKSSKWPFLVGFLFIAIPLTFFFMNFEKLMTLGKKYYKKYILQSKEILYPKAVLFKKYKITKNTHKSIRELYACKEPKERIIEFYQQEYPKLKILRCKIESGIYKLKFCANFPNNAEILMYCLRNKNLSKRIIKRIKREWKRESDMLNRYDRKIKKNENNKNLQRYLKNSKNAIVHSEKHLDLLCTYNLITEEKSIIVITKPENPIQKKSMQQ